MTKTKQLQEWEGGFGDSYTERNVVGWRNRWSAFNAILSGLQLTRILELGRNRGHSLFLLSKLCENAHVVGVEPNARAVRIAKEAAPQVSVLRGDVLRIPFKDAYFDLAFTANVLIHIALSEFPGALSEIHRVSRRHILAIEYFDEQETMIHYRCHDDLLWKRNFPKIYEELFPKLALVGSGYWDKEDGFDRSYWWLFEKGREIRNPSSCLRDAASQ